MSSQGKEKELVENFYCCFYTNPDNLAEYLHPEVQLSWHSSSGSSQMDFDAISALTHDMAGSYESLRTDMKKVIQEDGKIAVHFTYHVKTIENPDEEMALANFMAIWEIKDGKLFRGYQISQLADDAESPLD